jgi:hypothetical protein
MTRHLWLLVAIAGCIEPGTDELGTDVGEIRGGAETVEPGVVGIWIGGGSCSGSVIADDTVVLASHCFSGPPGDTQDIMVVELEPTGAYRCLTADTSVLGAVGADMETLRANPACKQWRARVRRDAGTDEENDFMVLRLMDRRFWGKNRDEAVRILGSARLELTNGLHADTADDTYRGFGYSSRLMGSVRMRSAVWEVEDDDDRYMNLPATDGQGVCEGDSGGPIGFRNLADLTGLRPRYTVAGVLSRADLDDDTDCAMEDGDDQKWTRISPYMGMITELLGRACRPMTFAGPEGTVLVMDCNNAMACVGMTRAGATAWQEVSDNTLQVDVDTTACGYDTRPLYFPTLHGNSHQWRAMGTSSVFMPTATGFRMIVTDRSGPVTAADANARQWSVAWHAVRPASTGPNGCTGISPSGAWHDNLGPGGGVYLDVVTSTCGFGSTTPTYVASLTGTGNHHLTTGASAIYDATSTGFRIYLHPHAGAVVTAAIANAGGWRVNWLGKTAPSPGEYCSGRTPTTGWTQYGPRGLTRIVDISACNTTVTPRVLASLAGSTMHWNTTGATAIYDLTPTSFQVYIFDESGPVTPADASDRGWRIEWSVRR